MQILIIDNLKKGRELTRVKFASDDAAFAKNIIKIIKTRVYWNVDLIFKISIINFF